jgi:histidinol-phosphate aminotransferase
MVDPYVLGESPGRIVVGVGARRGVSMAHLRHALAECLDAAGRRTRDIVAIVTIDGRPAEPALVELSELMSVPLSTLPAEHLAQHQVPATARPVERPVGAPSLAEAAVIASGARLLVPPHVGRGVTVALGVLPGEPRPDVPEPPTRALILRPGPDDRTVDLEHHGDAEAAPGLVNLAVNVRPDGPPAWLSARLHAALDQISDYPSQQRALSMVAARHRRPVDQVLLTSGGSEAFVLLARSLNPRRAVVVHPQFTEPEAALLAAGHDVQRVVLEPPFLLSSAVVPPDADLVIVGNPTNPTSVLHPAADLLALARPGRLLVVDEAFMDAVSDQGQSLAGDADHPPAPVPGLVVIRSLTMTWGLPGLRIGYLLGDAHVLSELAGSQALWPVSTIALEAAAACSEPAAVAEAQQRALDLDASRAYLVAGLTAIPGVRVVPGARASFVLFQVIGSRAGDVHGRLRAAGWAARRADTFPGLGPGWLRVAVRDRPTTDAFLHVLAAILQPADGSPSPPSANQ